jgi:hypothetical protein
MALSPEVMQKWREILLGNDATERNVSQDHLGPENYRKPRPRVQRPVEYFDELNPPERRVP